MRFKAGILVGAGFGLLTQIANADTLFHLKSRVWGCFDPNVTPIINDKANSEHQNSEWIAQTSAEGNCVLITPDSLWKVASADFNGLTYLMHRGAGSISGSFWVPTAAIEFGFPIQSVPSAVQVAPKARPPPARVIAPPNNPITSAAPDKASEGVGGKADASDSTEPPPATSSSSPIDTGDSGTGAFVVIALAILAWLVSRLRRRKSGKTGQAKRNGAPQQTSAKTAGEPVGPKLRPTAPVDVTLPHQLEGLSVAVTPAKSGEVVLHSTKEEELQHESAPRAKFHGKTLEPLAPSVELYERPYLNKKGHVGVSYYAKITLPGEREPSLHAVYDDARQRDMAVQAFLANRNAALGISPILPSSVLPAKKMNVTWHVPGEAVSVAGISLSDGMVYTGASSGSWDTNDFSFIDPKLAVAPSSAAAQAPGYWPSYRTLSPACRRRYLEWLASGRKAPGENIGYVLLFFFGLERRLMIDMPPANEIKILVAELERLKAIYSEDYTFNNHSRRLLDAAAFLQDDTILGQSQFSPNLFAPSGEMPLLLRVAIAREVVAGHTLGFDLAAAALFGLSQLWQANRQVLDQARPEFLKMFRPRFEARFQTGFLLRNRKDSRLRIIYSGASHGLSVDLNARAMLGDLPDPASLTWTKLFELAGPVAEQLIPYAKMLSYYPSRAHSLYGLVVAPKEVHNIIASAARIWLDDLPSPAAIRFGELASHAIGTASANWTVRHRRQVSDALAMMGRAMEPDPEDGSERLQDDTVVQVFHCTDRTRSRHLDTAWKAAMFVAMISATVAGSTGKVLESWLSLAPTRLSLTPEEDARLRARLNWLLTKVHTLARAKRLLGDAPQEERDFCAWSATVAASAAGIVNKSQIALLEAIHDALTVPRSALYAGLHSGLSAVAATADEPIIVSEEIHETLHTIPLAPELRAAVEDVDRLSQIRADTERVAAILKEIFADEEPATDASAKVVGAPLPGLDTEHSALLNNVLSQSEWRREAFDKISIAMGLMPAGAMETINEWAFDNFGDAVLEDGDPIIVRRELMQIDLAPTSN